MSDSLWLLIKTGGALALVLGLVFLSAYGAKRFFPSYLGRSGPLIHILSRAPLGSGREIAVVEIRGVCLVVGVTASQITLLAQLDDVAFSPAPSPNRESA